LTDNSGGAGNDTIVAIPALSATPLLLADAPTTTECNTVIDTIRDGVADLARKVNQVKNALEAYGLLSPT
jgi:ABC-type glutathione transport system ATPase component